MPQFQYKAKDRKGQLINGQLEAETRGAAGARLQSMGYFPVDIREAGGADNGGGVVAALSRRRAKRIRSTDMADFYRQMADLIGAGVPLVKALGIVKNQTPNPALVAILNQVMTDVQEGETFAGALDKHPKQFNKLNVALVRAGEAGGLLDQTLSRVADYSESQEELHAKIRSAMAYPMIMVCVGVVAVTILLTVVMPKVLIIFQELDQTLPLMTQTLLALVTFLQNYYLFLIAGIATAGITFYKFVHTDKGAFQFHKVLLSLPKLGDLITKREVAAFARTLGSLLRNGVPILNSLSIAAEVTTIRPIRKEIEKIPDSITQGSGIASSLRGSPLFPPLVVNMVAVGEETGHLPEVLLRVANSYETQVDRDIKTLTSFIEPIIILCLGLVVGYIVFSMLLPIFSIDPTKGM
ncbi:type II secretion system F family protein [bacterium]|nr:type II secretion system F family protein [bacterium]